MKSLLVLLAHSLPVFSAEAPVSLQEILGKSGSPGAVITTPGDGTRAIGSANWDRTRPMKVDMHFRIGSVTKLFIGNLVLKLRDQGKLSLDDVIARHIPGVPNGDRITLRQLGNHTSGLPDAIRNPDFQKAIVANPERVWAADEILSFAFKNVESIPAPGEKWSYSNTNTILLALAAEKAGGAPWGQLLQREILTPLGLDHTSIPTDGALPEPHPLAYRYGKPNHPIGYGKIRFDVTHYSASWTHAAGDLVSTGHDLGKAAKALCLGTLLEPDSRRELHRWQETGQHGHRYGFCIESWDGLIGHRGDVPGFQAVIAVREITGEAYSVTTNLSNTPDGNGPANTILEEIVRRGGGDPPPR